MEESPSEVRHRLIEEFRGILTSGEYEVPVKTDGVVALSAPSIPDHKARIELSIEVIKQIVAKKAGKTLESVTSEDIITHGPPLILNGDTKQLPEMAEIAQDLGFPKKKVESINCEKGGVANTKTQFEVMREDLRYENAKHLTFVTNAWHAPRAARTAAQSLRPGIIFDVIPVPHKRAPSNVYRVVRGEVKRIKLYLAKGDITRDHGKSTAEPSE